MWDDVEYWILDIYNQQTIILWVGNMLMSENVMENENVTRNAI